MLKDCRVAYSGKIDGNTSFKIYEPADKNYNNFRVFIERDGEITEVKVLSVQRYRDGGTTVVQSEYGQFYFPIAGSATLTKMKMKMNFLRMN